MIKLRKASGQRANAFDFIQVGIASPEDIRGPRDPKERERLELQGDRSWWSWGEVTKPETVNYRSFKPENDGLFCERIFGPIRDWECRCGKYARILYRGVVCDRCGVEVTLSKVRRERMGHIELAVPVAHIWYVRVRRVMSTLLGISLRDLEKVLYYSSYIVIDAGNQNVKVNQTLDEKEWLDLGAKANDEGDVKFATDIGAGAVRELLRRIDVGTLSNELRARIERETSPLRRKALRKRLDIADAFRNSGDSSGTPNRPEWMILDALPVLPPDLRPLVPLDGGRFATSDLNDLYRQVINRNKRVEKLLLHRAPAVMLRNEKRMLQEAVDALFDNGRRLRPVRGSGKRPLRSFSHLLTGKDARFRQNLLGKRVDYSGRSVIVVGPELQLHQCGLPRSMALELFKPFVIHKLVEKGVVETDKRAKRFIDGTMTHNGLREEREKLRRVNRDELRLLYDILEEVVRDHPVLLNRAPTLHRLGIQAFEPVLVAGKAIRVHPLVCAAFNADFDGDQMAVHVPLSPEAQLEARLLMLSSNNILRPSDGRPIVGPSQDIVLGCYFATKAPASFNTVDQAGLRRFGDLAEIEMAFDRNGLSLHSVLLYRVQGEAGSHWERTTTGRALFNALVPKELGYQNREMNKAELSELVFQSYRKAGPASTVRFVERLKEFGFTHATHAGVSIGIEDFSVPATKDQLIAETELRVARFQRAYAEGHVSDSERRDFARQQWLDAFDVLDDEVRAGLAMRDGGFNPLDLIVGSGARGSFAHVRQLTAAKGFIAKPESTTTSAGGALDRPVTQSLREGLDPIEYFRSCHGTRKGSSDHNIRTARAGYLTRRLVDVAHTVTISEEDCGTIQGFEASALRDENRVLESLAERIIGSIAAEDVRHPLLRDELGRARLIVAAGEMIEEDSAATIEANGIGTVKIRSVLTCETRRGVCRMCYGRNPATLSMVDLGEAVGVVAAQSAGEPTTQQLLNAKHVGGVASFIRRETGVDPRIVTDVGGFVRFIDLIDEQTIETTVDRRTGRPSTVIRRPRGSDLDPRIEIVERGRLRDRVVRAFVLPDGARLNAIDGAEVRPSAVLATMPDETLLLQDVAQGLAKLDALFEARVPANAAVLSEIDGMVRVGGMYRRAREVFVTGVASPVNGEEPVEDVRLYQVRAGARLLVQNGDRVRAGDRISEGSIDPHDVLRIKGPHAAQEYLLNAVQEVYRRQGIQILDQHIAVIVRQMFRAVRILDLGETALLEGQQVNREVFRSYNDRARRTHARPASAEPLLRGITGASLATESFISAASFQETPRVLTDAAVRGARDDLLGLKENVIVGHLIPAGTGMYRYREVDVRIEQSEDSGASPIADAFPDVFSMADDDEFPPPPRPGIRASLK